MELGNWSWLEICKIVAGALTPAALLVIGVYVHRVTKRFEHIQWRSQKLIEKRLAIYDDLAPLFNDVLCYFTYVGAWRDIDPHRIIELKRIIDKKSHLAAPLFSKDFFPACMKFQSLCYETYNGWGKDALLKTKFHRRRECRGEHWKDEWDTCFSANPADASEVRTAYLEIMRVFTKDIGVNENVVIPSTGSTPTNIL